MENIINHNIKLDCDFINSNIFNLTDSNLIILDSIVIDYDTIKYSTYSTLILIIRLLIR